MKTQDKNDDMREKGKDMKTYDGGMVDEPCMRNKDGNLSYILETLLNLTSP